MAYGLREHFRDEMTRGADRASASTGRSSLVGLPGIEDMRPSDLSGGMKKRVGLARAIAVQPEVLLYDEPTTGLDPINTERINHLITGLKGALNVTSIVVTHDMKSAFSISDRMAMVHSRRDHRCAARPRSSGSHRSAGARLHQRHRAGERGRRDPAP